jgi:hypothetical protein
VASKHTCVLCTFYHPDTTARPADTVCPGDRARLCRDLLAIPQLFRRVADGEQPLADQRWYETTDENGQPTGQLRRRDPIAGLLPAAPTPARVHRLTVTGSRDTALPIDVDAIDLTAPARDAQPLGDPRDQIGYLPVATVLDTWVRYVRDQLHPDFHLPDPHVDDLIKFLDTHLEETIEHLPDDLPALAAQLRSLCSALRHILQENDPPPRPLLGVRCGHCLTISSLEPWPSDEYVECRTCGQLYNRADRTALAKQQLKKLTDDETGD